MRLLRLTTTDPHAIFNSSFVDDIVLKKDSQIALQNVAIEGQESEITLTPSNNSITYKNSLIGSVQVDLETETYAPATIDNLLGDITDKMNASLGYSSAVANTNVLGMEWKAELNTDNKVQVGYKIGQYVAPGDPSVWLKTEEVDDEANGSFDRTWGLATGEAKRETYDEFMFYDEPIAKGCGFTRCQVHTLKNPSGQAAKSGFLLGLTSTNLTDTDPDSVDITYVKYGIRVKHNQTSGRYFYIVNGVETNANLDVGYIGDGSPDNDFIKLIISDGKVQFWYYQDNDGGVENLLHEEPYTPGEDLYPINFFFGERAEATINNASFTETPYFNAPTKAVTSGRLGQDLGTPAPPTPDELTKYPNFLEFESITLANFLGYINTRQPQSGTFTVNEIDYVADKKFTGRIKADAFLVELLNIPLDSYDGFVNQRKNLLAVVPESDDATGAVIYEPSTPFFIDLKNQDDILLRNVRARLVKADYSPYEMRGLATLTILIT